MTALIQTYQNITARISLGERAVGESFRFVRINDRGIVTYCLLGIMTLGALVYLAAVYAIFFSGFQVQSQQHQMVQLNNEREGVELKVQQAIAGFETTHGDILNGMEKISNVRYLGDEQSAVSYMSSR